MKQFLTRHSTRLEEEEVLNMDWQENDVDVIGEMDRKARLAIATKRKMSILNKKWREGIVGNLVESIIPTSIAGQVV